MGRPERTGTKAPRLEHVNVNKQYWEYNARRSEQTENYEGKSTGK